MKNKYLIFLSLVAAFAILFSSCGGDDSAYVKNIEGHWIYTKTKTEVYVTDSDPVVKAAVMKYIEERNNTYKVSYDFKNDKTYYCYRNYADPLKGIYKIADKNYYTIYDSRGSKTVLSEDSVILILSDMKDEIARELDIEPNKIIKATVTDIFERGLFAD